MENKYIKFIEGDQKSLDKACKIAEDNGYHNSMARNALRFEGNGILKLNKFNEYYTSEFTEEEMILDGCILLADLTKDDNEIKQGEEIYVSDISVEDALETKNKRVYITTLPGYISLKHITTNCDTMDCYKNNEKYICQNWAYIAKIPNENIIKPKFKIGDKVYGEDDNSYSIIFSITFNKGKNIYEYNIIRNSIGYSYLDGECSRLCTDEEINLYFN